MQSAPSQINLAPLPIQPAARLQRIADDSIGSVLQQLAARKLQSDQIAVTLVDLREPTHPEAASFRGDEMIYPARP